MSEPTRIFRISGIARDTGLRGLIRQPDRPQGLNQGTIHLPIRTEPGPSGPVQVRRIGFDREVRCNIETVIPWRAPAFILCSIFDQDGNLIVEQFPVPAPSEREEIIDGERVAFLGARVPAYQVPFPAGITGQVKILDEINSIYGSGSTETFIEVVGEDYGILPTFTLRAS